MNIEIISTYYREEFLAPLFMLHYEPWVDKITLLTEKFPNDRFDDQIKADWINEAIDYSGSDWVIIVDMDEFVFPLPFEGTNYRSVLENEQGNIINCEMLRVWRHKDDVSINPSCKPLYQRQHGNGVHDHTKPCIFRPGRIWTNVGCHTVSTDIDLRYGKPWGAVHWANADPSFGIQRTIRDRQSRLSDRNIQNRWGYMPQWLEPDHLDDLYNSHLNDPLIKFFQ